MKSSYLAHGKVIIIGEHPVVYGYDALAMPIKALHIKTTVESASQMWMDTAADFVLDRKLEINERSWNHLSLELNTQAQNTQLFDIIETYFPSILQSN